MKNFLHIWLVTFGLGIKSKIDDADFIEQNSYEVGFSAFYKSKIKSLLPSLEEIRIKKLKQIALRGRLTLLLWLILPTIVWIGIGKILSSANIGDLEEVVIGFIIAFTLLFLLFSPPLIYKILPQFKREVEEELFEKIFEFFGDFNYKNQRDEKDAYENYKQFKFLHSPGGGLRWVARDYILGSYKNKNLSYERLQLSQVLPSGSNRTRILNGVAIFFETRSSLRNCTIILKKQFRNWTLADLYRRKIYIQKVRFQDQEFNKMFEVYSEDEQEAKNLITPNLIEEFKRLPKNFNSKKVQASFCDKKLLLTLDGINLFQFRGSVFKPFNLDIECRQILKQMNLIFSVGDAFGWNKSDSA